jgi:hypothetical protein
MNRGTLARLRAAAADRVREHSATTAAAAAADDGPARERERDSRRRPPHHSTAAAWFMSQGMFLLPFPAEPEDLFGFAEPGGRGGGGGGFGGGFLPADGWRMGFPGGPRGAHMPLPPHLLFSDRDFTADDYELLCRLDDTVENRKGASQQDIDDLPTLVSRNA